MQTASRRQIDFETRNTTNIKVNNKHNTKSNEFSKTTYIIITAATMILISFVYLQILL
jgi:hypothetical protein